MLNQDSTLEVTIEEATSLHAHTAGQTCQPSTATTSTAVERTVGQSNTAFVHLDRDLDVIFPGRGAAGAAACTTTRGGPATELYTIQ